MFYLANCQNFRFAQLSCPFVFNLFVCPHSICSSPTCLFVSIFCLSPTFSPSMPFVHPIPFPFSFPNNFSSPRIVRLLSLYDPTLFHGHKLLGDQQILGDRHGDICMTERTKYIHLLYDYVCFCKSVMLFSAI